MGYRLNGRGSMPDGEIFFSSPQRPDRLWGLLASIQWVPGAFFRGVKRHEREADHSQLHLVPRLGIVELYLHSPYVFMLLCLIRYAQGQPFHNFSFAIIRHLSMLRRGAAAVYASLALLQYFVRYHSRGSSSAQVSCGLLIAGGVSLLYSYCRGTSWGRLGNWGTVTCGMGRVRQITVSGIGCLSLLKSKTVIIHFTSKHKT
jgi:hypothetical protein